MNIELLIECKLTNGCSKRGALKKFKVLKCQCIKDHRSGECRINDRTLTMKLHGTLKEKWYVLFKLLYNPYVFRIRYLSDFNNETVHVYNR